MTEPRRSPEELLKTSISRRRVLQGGLLAGSAAFLAACGASATPSPAPTAPPAATPAPTAPPAATPAPTASAAPATATPAASASAAPSATPAASAAAPTPAPTSFAGVKLNGFSGGFSLHAEAIGLAAGKAATGGNATFDNVPFNEKPVKLATIIATQDSSWDTMYTSDNFMALFGARLLIPIEPWFGDTSDFPASVLNEFTTQSDMVLRGIPNFHDSYYWSHNPTLWAQGGGDPNNIPTVWDDLIALAPEFLAKGVKPSVQPWIGTDGGFAVFYFKQMYNSFNVPFLNADRTQVAFGGPEGMAVFTTIANGLKNGYWDNTTLNIGNEHDAFTLFAQGKYACLVDGTDNPKTGLNSSNYIVGVMPGMKAGSTGSVNGDDGLGVNKFSPNQGRVDEASCKRCTRSPWRSRLLSRPPRSTVHRASPCRPTRHSSRSRPTRPPRSSRRTPPARPASGRRRTTTRPSSTMCSRSSSRARTRARRRHSTPRSRASRT